MGYHLRKIEKRPIGTIGKIIEEVEEYQDAIEQKCEIMAILELADIYGALEMVAEKHGRTMEDLKTMAGITRRAFEDGSRKTSNILDEVVDYVSVGDMSVRLCRAYLQQSKNDHISLVPDDVVVTTYRCTAREGERVGVTIKHLKTGFDTSCATEKTEEDNKKIAIPNLLQKIRENQNLLFAVDVLIPPVILGSHKYSTL